MKIVFSSILSVFFFLFGLELFLQTPMAKNEVKKWIIRSLEKENIKLEIGSIEGHVPFEWKLKNIQGQLKDPFFIESLKIRFGILPLLKKQLEITHLRVKGIEFKGLAFQASLKGRYDLKKEKPIKISHFLLEGDDLFARVEGKFGYDFSILEADASFHIQNLAWLHKGLSQGSLSGFTSVTKDKAHLESFAKDVWFQDHPIAPTNLTFDASKTKTWWDGTAQIVGGPIDLPINGGLSFRYTPSCKLISIEDFQFDSEETKIYGKMDLDPSFQCFEGTIFANCKNLKNFRPFFPESKLKGKLQSKIDFQSFSKFQDLKCQIDVQKFGIFETVCKNLSIETTIYDVFGDLRGDFAIKGENLSLPNARLSQFEIASIFEPGTSPFHFALKGNWNDPLEITGKGWWQKRGSGVFLDVKDFGGYAFKKPFSLCEPFSLEWNSDHFKMSNFSLDIANGHLFSRIDLTKTTSLIKIKAEEFPLEFIALPHKHFSLSGTSQFDIDLISWEDNIQGNLNIALKKGTLKAEGVQNALTTKGSLQVHLNKKQAQIHGELKAKGEQFIHFFGNLPIKYQHFPFKIAIDHDRQLAAELTSEGKLEDLFDFINIGAHRIQGWLSSNLFISKTFKQPALQGKIELQNGYYENYYTGTELREIEAKARVQNQSIAIESFTAKDKENGKISGTGSIKLNPAKHFPYALHTKLKKFSAVAFDTITGKFSGHVTIEGNQLGSKASGSLKVAEVHFRIPDQLPTIIPELPIKFINLPESIEKSPTLSTTSSPLALDLDIDVPAKAFVEGKGINSELKGKLHITGTYTDIAASGTLQLVKGEYIFSGKVFNLTQGELIFKNEPTPSAYISLTGNCDLPDVDVTVHLRGPLSSPKLSFQSSPQMPTSSLLSQILFNKDIADISPVQALQVAQTVISLSGSSGPDILEKIRKTLGIDRLTLITSENDPGKISLQIGKYLMKGVMLSLSKGRESQNVAVEVELKKGIYFQAEVNETQEGKFSLKWHHHY